MAGPRVVVAGGHSAGHIEPAMNFADALRRLAPDAEVTALGTSRGLDTALIPARGYPLELIPAAPLPRALGRELLRTPARLFRSVRAAGSVLDRTRAEAVVGFGGYVALSGYLAAFCRGLPIVVHEANARPGLANRLAARLTRQVFTGTPDVRLAHASAIGIPLRPSIAGLDRASLRAEARRRFGLRSAGPVLLVTGGSQGAQTLNQAVSGAAPALRSAGVQVLHIAGPGRSVPVPEGQPTDPPYVLLPYLEEMRFAYAAADFVICRSGAMTCAELAAVGLPAAYVPLPLRGGEQRRNAEPLVALGGALLAEDAEVDAAWVERQVIPVLTDAGRLRRMSSRAAAFGTPHADADLAGRVLGLIAGRRAAAPRSRARRPAAGPR